MRFGMHWSRAGAEEVHAEALEALRIACGIPKFGVDIRQKDLPQETGQERALNFTKGCYIGQEIVERIRSRGAVHRMLTGFEVSGRGRRRGFGFRKMGRMWRRLPAWLTVPTEGGERTLALGYGRREVMVAGREFVMGETKDSGCGGAVFGNFSGGLSATDSFAGEGARATRSRARVEEIHG